MLPGLPTIPCWLGLLLCPDLYQLLSRAKNHMTRIDSPTSGGRTIFTYSMKLPDTQTKPELGVEEKGGMWLLVSSL